MSADNAESTENTASAAPAADAPLVIDFSEDGEKT